MNNKRIPKIGDLVYYNLLTLFASDGGNYGKLSPERLQPGIAAAMITDVAISLNNETFPNVRLIVFDPDGIFHTAWTLRGTDPGHWDWKSEIE